MDSSNFSYDPLYEAAITYSKLINITYDIYISVHIKNENLINHVCLVFSPEDFSHLCGFQHLNDKIKDMVRDNTLKRVLNQNITFNSIIHNHNIDDIVLSNFISRLNVLSRLEINLDKKFPPIKGRITNSEINESTSFFSKFDKSRISNDFKSRSRLKDGYILKSRYDDKALEFTFFMDDIEKNGYIIPYSNFNDTFDYTRGCPPTKMLFKEKFYWKNSGTKKRKLLNSIVIDKDPDFILDKNILDQFPSHDYSIYCLGEQNFVKVKPEDKLQDIVSNCVLNSITDNSYDFNDIMKKIDNKLDNCTKPGINKDLP